MNDPKGKIRNRRQKAQPKHTQLRLTDHKAEVNSITRQYRGREKKGGTWEVDGKHRRHKKVEHI